MSPEKEFENSLRSCEIHKWEGFDGYGFNLHAEKGKPGQYIGKVDEGSPAEAAGLKEGDRIIEVNNVNIANENHKQVVQRIKALLDVTTLLVVDHEGDAHYQSTNTVLKSSLPSVVNMKNPPEPKLSQEDYKNGGSIQHEKPLKDTQDNENNHTVLINPSGNDNQDAVDYNNHQNNSLNLNMTAKELRAQLAAKKKYDPKKDHTIDFKKKYDIVQKL